MFKYCATSKLSFPQMLGALVLTLFPVTDQCLCSCSKDSLDAKAEDVFNLVILHPEDAPKWGGNITFSCVSISLITMKKQIFHFLCLWLQRNYFCQLLQPLLQWYGRGLNNFLTSVQHCFECVKTVKVNKDFSVRKGNYPNIEGSFCRFFF